MDSRQSDDINFATRQGRAGLIEWVRSNAGAQTKFVTDGWRGGAGASESRTRAAIRRLEQGFRFVGITDEWETTVCLFHRMIMADRPCLPVEFANNRPTSVVPGTQIMNSSLGGVVLQQAGVVDPHDTAFFDAVQKIFLHNQRQYGVTPEACAALRCTKSSWTAEDLALSIARDAI